jgi:hypothetical protein
MVCTAWAVQLRLVVVIGVGEQIGRRRALILLGAQCLYLLLPLSRGRLNIRQRSHYRCNGAENGDRQDEERDPHLGSALRNLFGIAQSVNGVAKIFHVTPQGPGTRRGRGRE